ARPLQAAWASALSFALGAGLPLLIVALLPGADLLVPVAGGSLVGLAMLGVLAANTGGARASVAALRVTFWGAIAMALTTVIGSLFGAVL
ncbi:MAG: VIT1/CCC1 transporter family protein, partial [Spongiibacteraceae bacterium]